MADLDRIKRNVQKMAMQGAPETEIDGYLQGEGVTSDQVREHRPQGWLRSAAQGAVDMVRGKQDPAYAGAPALTKAQDLPPAARGRMIEGMAAAKTTAVSDPAYADVLRTQLGDSFVRQETDANGYPVLVYRNKDGQESKAYANQPGLDWEDFDRGMSATMPYLLGGGAIGAATKGANLGIRALAQGATGAGVSVAQDVGASQMGSEQGLDGTRAVVAGGLGAAGELAAPLLQWGKGALGFGAKYIDDAGKLTPEGTSAVRRAGANPADLDEETTKAFAEALRQGRDPAEVLSQVRSNRFGIPTTKGQRTKDPELLAVEKDIRYGNLGPDAKTKLDTLDRQQSQAITNQVRGHIVQGRDGIDEFQGLGAQIAPTRMPNEQNWETLGQSVRGGLTEARDTLKGQERAAWDAVPDMLPQPQAFDELPNAIGGQLGRMRVDGQLTPTAMRMDAELAAFRDGKGIIADGPKMVQQTPIRTIDEMRRRLLDTYKSAPPGTADAKAAKAYYDGFDDWAWDAAEKGLLNATTADLAKMNAAREITREVKGLFKARNAQGRGTPANRIIDQVMDEADTPEGVISSLLGAAGPHTPPKAGVVDALRRIKAILDKAGGAGGSMAGKDTWNDIRLAYWLRLTTGKDGATLSPTMLRKNIDQAFTSQSSVLRTLFSDLERKEMRAFSRGVGEAAYKDPNPSGTASALRAMTRNGGNNVAKTFLQSQANRELFSKHNVWMSRFYRFLAQKVPNLGGTRDAIGLRAAQRAVDQSLTPRRRPVTGPFFSAYGGQQTDE
jgi:hypothetical protein